MEFSFSFRLAAVIYYYNLLGCSCDDNFAFTACGESEICHSRFEIAIDIRSKLDSKHL
jgi:hypothetical protein